MYSKQTSIIHFEDPSEPNYKTVNPPLHRGSTLVFDTIEEFQKTDALGAADKSYGRGGTPTVSVLESWLAKLDEAEHCIVMPSGMSAISTAIMSFINIDDHILVTDSIYGSTKRFINEELKDKLNTEVTYFTPNLTNELEDLIQDNTKFIFLESPASNSFEIHDLEAICKIAKKHNIITILDNSWACPLLSKPFSWGIDVCVQSLTKYVNGHADVILGSITTNEKYYKTIYNTFRNHGTIPSPELCSLAFRGLKTLYVRLQHHEKAAIEIAQWLQKRPEVKKVLHPALPDFPDHELWKKYYNGSNGVLSFILDESYTKEHVNTFINSLKLFSIGLSWGSFESLVMSVDISHTNLVKQHSLSGHCIRLHIGLENTEEIAIDLEQAFNVLSK